MGFSEEKMGELLVRSALLTDDQLGAALVEQGAKPGKLGEVLVRELILSEEQIAHAVTEQKNLSHRNLADAEIDRKVVGLLPVGMAQRHGVIPVAVDDGELVLAMADPLDIHAIDEVELHTGFSEGELPTLRVMRAVGCETCRGTGHKGRVGLYEVMQMDEDLVRLHLESAPAESPRAVAIANGMRTLRRDGLDKVALGITTIDEIARVVY